MPTARRPSRAPWRPTASWRSSRRPGRPRSGYRVLAVAERDASTRRDLREERIQRLAFVGLLALTDPIRASAAAAVRGLRAAGVDVLMLTGDHPSTAEAIAAELDLLDGRPVVTGPQLDTLADPDLTQLVRDASVFARVSPTHKVRIVAALQHAGRVVAVCCGESGSRSTR